ncbi:MAG: tRNA 2-selenouridine synthase [Planctomycetota bacterium]|jgi:tRNA 2-selenouridine synthase
MSVEASPNPNLTPVPCVEINSLLARADALVIDMRSPAEFEQDHLSGALNVPLFDDAQRALVGFLYKQRSPEQAFAEGIEIVQQQIEPVLTRVAELAGWAAPEGSLEQHVTAMTADGIEAMERKLQGALTGSLPARPVILHCLRGGLRSRSVVALLRRLGYDDCFALQGGYQEYRRHIRQGLEDWEAPPAFALRGLTGVGKTLVLRELEQIRPRWTVDLEGLAGHRSSLLGMVGLKPCSQKTFESRIAARIEVGFDNRVVYEGESRRVGKAEIPVRMWESLQTAQNIELVAPPERRVQVLCDDYLADPSARPLLREQIVAVEKRMQTGGRLARLFDEAREPELTQVLLDEYYDPLYRHSETGREYGVSIDSTDPGEAALQIAQWIEGAADR